MRAMLSLDKQEIINKADSMAMFTPEGKYAITFIENHDTDRVASVLAGDPGKMRAAAVLNILTRGVPLIYYGQELGMKGVKGNWGHDGNDIPRREAFEWTTTTNTPGMALWYKDSGPWWDQTNLKDADGISLEEEQTDKTSLWSHYQHLIALRKAHPALMRGDQTFLQTNNPEVLAFERKYRDEVARITVNLSTEDVSSLISFTHGEAAVSLDAYGYEVTFR